MVQRNNPEADCAADDMAEMLRTMAKISRQSCKVASKASSRLTSAAELRVEARRRGLSAGHTKTLSPGGRVGKPQLIYILCSRVSAGEESYLDFVTSTNADSPASIHSGIYQPTSPQNAAPSGVRNLSGAIASRRSKFRANIGKSESKAVAFV